MATAPSSPTARRWELAARLRQLRVEAGKSIEEAAAELMCSAAKISRMETGGRGVLPRDVRDLCRLYGVADETRDNLIKLAAESKKPGWWQDFRTLPEMVATYVGLEAAASVERTLETRVVPGLLATTDYARLLLTGLRPLEQRVPGEVDDLLVSRERRQLRLLDGSLEYSAILDQAVLARDFGAPAVMLDQVDHLLEVAEWPNVSVRVVPFGSPPYAGIDGSFIYLGFDNPAISDVIYVEGMLGNYILDRPSDVDRYVVAYQDTLDRVTLSPGETVTWLKGFRDSIASGQGAGAKASPRKRSS